MPDLWLDVDAALAEVPVNIYPLTDDTDFKTRETAIAYNQAGMDLTWNFVTCAGAMSQTAVTPTTGGDYDWAHQGDGMYSIEIPASGGASINNDTEGFGWFTGYATGVLPWRGPVIGFRRAALNDLLIEGSTASTNLEDMFDGTGYAGGTTKLAVDAVAISGDSTAADNLEAACDGGSYNVGGGAVVAASVTGAVGSVTGAVGSVTGTVGSVASYGTLVADVATAVWAAGTRTLTSFGTLIADIWAGITQAALAKFANTDTGETTAAAGSVAKLAQGSASMTEADIWSYATRTLTQSAAQVAAVVAGSTLTVQRGDTLSAALTGLGSIVGRTKLWFTAKRHLDDADTASIIQIEETAGLVYLNGAAGTALDGAITVDDEDAGDITITLAAVASAELAAGSYSYDIQWVDASDGVHTLSGGPVRVTPDVTRATS